MRAVVIALAAILAAPPAFAQAPAAATAAAPAPAGNSRTFLGLKLGVGLAFTSTRTDVVDVLGFGWMLGLRRITDAGKPEESASWNLGVGAALDPAAKRLGDGVVRNQPLRAGETTPRTKRDGVWSFLMISSFSW